MTTNALIEDIQKESKPNEPYYIEEGITHVDATASVPIELSFRGVEKVGPVGVDIVFLIDNSGSMRGSEGNDPDGVRYTAIQALASHFKQDRNELDHISIVSFSGEPDGPETEVWQDWKTWGETEVYVAMRALHPPRAGTYTPMARGMQLANNQFATSTRFYKMVIMLTDGLPEREGHFPDREQELEIETVHIPDAVDEQILYSAILLGASDDEASILLARIAEATDYITEPPENPPRFYFQTANVNEIESEYEELFRALFERVVPQRVILTEKVNAKLRVDNVSFSLDASSQNAIHASTPLADAIEDFKQVDGRFRIVLKELIGEAVLKFSVKLNMDWVNEEELNEDFIHVPVNVIDTAQSGIQYDYPVDAGYITIGPSELPQTTIRFLTGVHVTKELIDPSSAGIDDNHSVQITMANVALTKLDWFWIKEFPSFYVDTMQIEDDYNFSPLNLIINHMLFPFTMTYLHEFDLWREAVRTYFQDIASMFADQIDPYLCRFWFTYNQSGIFKLATDIESLGVRRLTFKVKGISFGEPTQLNEPVDNPAIKPPESSRYRYPGVEQWKYLQPNPDFSQIRLPGPRPEMSIRTCFDRDIDLFFESLLRIRSLPSYLCLDGIRERESEGRWKMLDSEHISPSGLWNSPADESFGLFINIYNRGTCGGSSTVRAKSILIPFPEPSGQLNEPSLSSTMVYTSEGQIEVECREAAYGPFPSGTIHLTYDSLTKDDGTTVKLDKNIPRSFSGFMINIVYIDAATGVGTDAKDELLLSNNSAIEVIRVLKPSVTEEETWFEKVWRLVISWFSWSRHR